MIGLLIVDDEKIIREGIRGCTNWEQNGIQVVGVAQNGKEALEIFQKEKPRLVITDIKMPHMDGLEFIRRLREEDNDAKVIVLSGYDDFKYAREAMHYRVEDYLLKPVQPKELIKLILQAKEAYLAENNRRDHEIRVWHQIQENLPAIEERFFNDLMEGCQYSEKSLIEKLHFLNIEYQLDDDYGVMILSIDAYNKGSENISEHNRQIMHYMALEDIKNALPEGARAWSHLSGEFGVVMPLKEGGEESLEEMAEKIKEALQRGCGFGVTIGVGGIRKGLSDLHLSWTEAKKALKYRMIMGSDQIIHYRIIEENASNSWFYSEAVEENIIFAIKNADKSALAESMNVFFNQNIKKVQPQYVKACCIKLVLAVSMSIVQMGENVDESIGNWIKICADIEECNSLDKIIQIMKSILERAVNYIDEKCCNNSSPIIDKIMTYLKEHIAEELSLKKIANEVYLTPNYICNLFKHHTGQNIGDYLTMLRIEYAKELLKDPKYKIYEVANAVGYTDSRYFGSLFKKHTGLSLSEYREKA